MPARTWDADAIRRSMLVYAVTDRAWLNGRSLAECVRQAIAGGATFVQLREKDAPKEEILALARELVEICREAGFGSQRSCNRVFQEEQHMTPLQYRRFSRGGEM